MRRLLFRAGRRADLIREFKDTKPPLPPPLNGFYYVCYHLPAKLLRRLYVPPSDLAPTDGPPSMLKEASLAALGMSLDQMREKVEELGDLGFVQDVREQMLGRNITVSGRSIVDDQGAMVLADGFEVEVHDAQMRASELRAQWGWA